MEYEIYRVDELYHHGVRGMKWGVRRYQNKDGSLTPRGKKRYDAELKKVREQEKVLKNRQATRAKIEKLEARKKAAADTEAALDAADGNTKKRKLFGRKEKVEKAPKKSIKDMSDVELYEAINRARLEDTYRQLRPEKVEKSKPFKKLVDDVVTPAATNAGRKFLEDALKQAGAKLLEGKVDPDSIEAMTKMRDKLRLRNEIEKLKKNDPDADLSWGDRIKKQTWEANEAKRKEAEDTKRANEAARQANERRSREEYEKANGAYQYSYAYNTGRQHVQSSDTWSGKVAGLLESPKVNSGKQYLLEGPSDEIIDSRTGEVLLRMPRNRGWE